MRMRGCGRGSGWCPMAGFGRSCVEPHVRWETVWYHIVFCTPILKFGFWVSFPGVSVPTTFFHDERQREIVSSAKP